MLRIPNWLFISFIIVSFVGFLDSTFLTFEHYNQGILPCYVFSGCEEVTTSKYATVGGVPVSLVGAVFYLLIFLAAIFYLDSKNTKALRVLTFLPAAGFLASLWFLYLQLFVIQAVCFYCVVSLVSSTLLFVFSIFLGKKSNFISSSKFDPQ